jgi:hypothetical protein
LEDDNDYVQFNNTKIKVENIGYSDYYYTLHKREMTKKGRAVTLPEEASYLLNQLEFEDEEEQGEEEENDDEDSNRESNPDFDYPEEEEEEDKSDDEGIINRDYFCEGADDEEDGESDGEQIDEDEVWRKYLKRCEKNDGGEKSDDEYWAD